MQGLYFANHLHCFTCYPPVTSACLLVTSLLRTVLLARTGLPVTLSSASFLHLAVTVRPSAHDTPLLLQPLALLPSHLLPSLTISPISSLPALAALMHTTFSLSVFSIPVYPFLASCCRITSLLTSCYLTSPCLALLLWVWHLPSPNSLRCLSLHSHPISFYYFTIVFLSRCHLPLQCLLFVAHPQNLSVCLFSLLLDALFPTMCVHCYFHSLPVLASPLCWRLPSSQQLHLLSTHNIVVYHAIYCLILLPKCLGPFSDLCRATVC